VALYLSVPAAGEVCPKRVVGRGHHVAVEVSCTAWGSRPLGRKPARISLMTQSIASRRMITFFFLPHPSPNDLHHHHFAPSLMNRYPCILSSRIQSVRALRELSSDNLLLPFLPRLPLILFDCQTHDLSRRPRRLLAPPPAIPSAAPDFTSFHQMPPSSPTFCANNRSRWPRRSTVGV
jgi:hypothetical protein